MLDYLRELGATDEQVHAAAESDAPARLAIDLVLSRTFTLSARDVAAEVGVSLDDVRRVATDMGMRIDDPDAPQFSADDVELVRLTQEMSSGLSHVVSSAFGRIADASVAVYIKEVDPRLAMHRDSSATGRRSMFENFLIRFGQPRAEMDQLSLAKANAAAGELALRAANSLGSAFVHALVDAVRWQRLTQSDRSDPALSTVAIGFVDLVGFTAMSREMTVAELSELVVQFEATAFTIANLRGGRIIKQVGDEVMFAALDSVTGASIAADIVEAFCERDICPRGGVAFGDVLAIHGDYYGSVVNLASRLTDEAIPGEVLVDSATAAAVDDSGGVVESAGRRMLKGFDQPLAVFTYVGTEAGTTPTATEGC